MVQAMGGELGYMQLLPMLAGAECKAGAFSEGLAAVEKALALVDATECRMDEPEMHRLKGELLLMQGEAELEAENCFHHAIEVARRQQAKSWELRATTSLCRLWYKQGEAREARQVLDPIYGWFTEGSDTPDLQEAKTLLE